MRAAIARAEVERFRSVVGRRLGLHFDNERVETLERVLRERMASSGMTHFGTYEGRLAGPEELGLVADRLTVGETYFFRYWDHFRAFQEVVMPDRTRVRGGEPVRILSAGCASGEEAYSLAILAHEQGATRATVHGFDVSPAMVERARRAHYTNWSLRATSPERHARYFDGDGRDHQLHESVVRMATFEQRNLVDDDSMFWRPGAFDVIFCRNVLMYFEPEVMVEAVARMARALSPGGFMFLGHAETLRGVSEEFDLRNTHETFYYQKRGGRPSVAPSAPSRGPSPSWTHEERSLAESVDGSWVDAIQRAADRIVHLTETSGTSRSPHTRATERAELPATFPVPPKTFDLDPTLELLREERFADAMALLETLGRRAPASDAELLRAVLLTSCGRLNEAEGACAAILSADDQSAGAHYVLALCRDHAGDIAAAAEHYRAAIDLDASFAMPHLHLGLLARRAGDLQLARSALTQAVGLLATEAPSRILMFGGGFQREALADLARSGLRRSGGAE